MFNAWFMVVFVEDDVVVVVVDEDCGEVMARWRGVSELVVLGSCGSALC